MLFFNQNFFGIINIVNLTTRIHKGGINFTVIEFTFQLIKESLETFGIVIAFFYISSRLNLFRNIIEFKLLAENKKLFYFLYFSVFSVLLTLLPFNLQDQYLSTFKAAPPIMGGLFGGRGVGFGVALVGGLFKTIYLEHPVTLVVLIPIIVAGGLAELWRKNTFNIREILSISLYILFIYISIELLFVYLMSQGSFEQLISKLHFHVLELFLNLGAIAIFLGIVEELRQKEEHLGVLHQLALTDEMTKTYNYRYFQNYLKEQIKRYELKFGGNISLLFIDLDNFKEYNDTYGHKHGDKLLKEITDILSRHIRPRDVMCRYGGDEFAIILPETSGKIAYNVGERLRKAVEERNFKINNPNKKITISIGIASYQKWMELDEFLSAADKALYEAKEKGRNNISLHSSCYL